MFQPLKKAILCWTILTIAVATLTFMYISRGNMYELNWTYLLLIIYGTIVTPFLIFRTIITYQYKPIPDKGYRPHVSVIVPVYNEENGIDHTIDSILNSDYPKDKIELIVIDDKSKDKTLEVVNKKSQEKTFKIVAQPQNMGKRHAMAAGLKQCTGEILVCVDSDTILKPDAIKNLVQPFTDKDVYCVCGSAIVANDTDPKSNTIIARFQKVWYADSFRLRKGTESIFNMVICCSGVLSAYRKEKFESVTEEWLNEKFLGREVISGDDRQMTNLMMRMGGKSKFQSNAQAYTFAPHKLKKFLIQQIRWGRSGFRGMIFASKFFTKKSAKQKILFYTTLFVTFISPISLLANTIGLALIGQYDLILGYFAGLLIVSTIAALSDKVLVDYFTLKDISYRIAFFAISIMLTFVYLYSWLTLWKGKTWGTR
ncbi:MAG: glycosyltransferase family 2 protein [Nitrososphaerota archaeon]|jgi:hyaluronan synthase|nr:glycosyltransferase family 2 protein [Nitrososphaerota archaeon]